MTLIVILAVLVAPLAMVFMFVFIVGGFMDEQTAREIRRLAGRLPLDNQ